MASGTPAGDWKHAASSERASAPRAKSRRSWQAEEAPPETPTGKRRSPLRRFLMAGIAAGILLALIVVLIEWWKPARYPSLVVVGPDSPGSLSLSENVAGRNSAATLTEWTGGGRNRPKSAASSSETAERDAWKSRLDPNARAVVLYFTTHGGADPEGPFLWMVPSDARAPAESHKLRVREILDRLAGLPKEQPKLLIFDATRVTASWPHGMLFNDFARALKELNGEIAKIDGLAVICASDDDQRSWVSEEWRASVFGHFLLEGLKGAPGKPGERITADRLFDFASGEVSRWAVANRDEKQTPVLLPRDGGRERAAKIELSAVPNEGYQPLAALEPPAKVPADLEAAWETAAQLANRVPAPDTTNPTKWREYLDLLMRWDRLVRLGEDPEAVRAHVRVLAEQLKNGAVGAEPVCLPAAIPVTRALGFQPSAQDADAFRRLWDPAAGVLRADEWAKQLGPDRKNETARRLVVAEQVLTRVLADGPTPEVLKTADEVLAVVDGSRVGPAEAHFLRMLHRHLDPKSRPPVELLRAAIRLRMEAEETAWVGGIGSDAYPYPEQVFRWVRTHVEAGDTARELGQDLLFDADPKSWELAQNKYFPEAQAHYRKANEDARVIAAALATRDKVLARLPYYARWVAGYRGKLPTAEVESLLAKVETAASGAHKLAELTLDVPSDAAERVKEIAATNAETESTFSAVAKAFESDVRELSNVVHPSNWHALDGALAVPFIPARDRVKLLGYVRDVSYQLATKSEQAGGVTAPSASAQEVAKRHGRLGVAILGERSAELRQLIDLPKQGAWWESYRDAGERIGRRFRGQSDAVGTDFAKANTTSELRQAAPHLGRASYTTRCADSSAPVTGSDPVAADQRYWRHYLLLWQAERTIRAGWADVADGVQGDWYCRKAAQLFTDSAKELVRGSEPNLPPAEIDRRFADARATEKLAPAMLSLTAPASRELADEASWDFEFSLARIADNPVGLPVFWLAPPGAPYTAPNASAAGRKAEVRFASGEKIIRRATRFATIPQSEDVPNPGKLATTVLYRGHRYQATTDIRLAGAPTLDWRYLPPKGPAAFAILANRELIAGALTLVIDMSGSMSEPVPGTTRKRIQETFDALEVMLDELPRNTTLTIAFFWGDSAVHVEALPAATKLVWRGDAVQKQDVMKAVRAKVPVPQGNTPLARSVRQILSKDAVAQFWPESSSGTRTLVVLTDGEDNWDKEKAGAVVLKALLEGDTKEDTALHVIFFGMSEADEAAADKQYRILEDPEHYRDTGRTPARLWRGVRDAKGLAERLREAMLPRVSYRREDTAGGRKQSGRLLVTLPNEGLYRPTGPLTPGVYDLWGLRAPQKLRLTPGDRVLLKARQKGDSFDLFVPPFAFETADRRDTPRGTAGNSTRGGVHLTIPELAIEERTGSCDLNLVTTMEPIGGSPAGPIQEMPRPLFPWFEVNYADGKPASKGLRSGLRVVNRSDIVAPAWDVKVSQWDVNRSRDTARRPSVSGYWIEGLPDPTAKYPIDLANPEQSAAKLPKTAGVELISVSVEEVTGTELPPGKYLTVRLKYAERGKPVFLRPGKLKGPEQPFLLAERHLFFDAQTRYTARFGPLSPKDIEGSVTLEMFPVEELKERATKTSRGVTVRFPDRRLDPYYLPDELRLEPAKE